MRSSKPLPFQSGDFSRLTHYLFRYPAKFHPPVARALVERYTSPGQTVLDCFCGSGTLLIEASAVGRHSIGTDIDPLAVWISRVKAHRYRPLRLRQDCQRLCEKLAPLEGAISPWREHAKCDLSDTESDQIIESEGLWVPRIPNITHWFRRGILIDLARLHRLILSEDLPHNHRRFILLCFASILRGVSNADPTPVSGLEVTSHMRRQEARGRRIAPFKNFRRAVSQGCDAVGAWFGVDQKGSRRVVKLSDARLLAKSIRRQVDAVITSPPYFNAVDYYRRHALEMYWLKLCADPSDRIALRGRYIGRYRVKLADLTGRQCPETARLTLGWRNHFGQTSKVKARDFEHYAVAMSDAFDQMAQILTTGRPAVIVIGNSRWTGVTIPTRDILIELASPSFRLTELWEYPIRNRYMSYQRNNSADIDKEYVCVLRRK